MRTTLLLLCSLCFLPGSILAMGDEMHEMHQHTAVASVAEQTITATGKIKSISDDGMSIRIFHDPIPELKWPAMNMIFKVQDHGVSHTLVPEDKVSFEFIRKDGENIITKITK